MKIKEKIIRSYSIILNRRVVTVQVFDVECKGEIVILLIVWVSVNRQTFDVREDIIENVCNQLLYLHIRKQ